MIIHKSNLAGSQPRVSRLPNPTGGSRDNLNHGIGRHSPVHSKLSDELREYLRDQPRLVLIGVNGVARPFFHLPFHSAASSHGEQENNARQY